MENAKARGPVILRIAEVQARTGLARPTIYRLIQQGKFPAGVDILGNGRVIGWSSDAIDGWVSARLAGGAA